MQTYPQQSFAQWFAEFHAAQVTQRLNNLDLPNQIKYEKKLHENDVDAGFQFNIVHYHGSNQNDQWTSRG